MDSASLHVAYNQTLLFLQQRRFDEALNWLGFRKLVPPPSKGAVNLEEVRQARHACLSQHQQLPIQRRGVMNMPETGYSGVTIHG